MCDLDFLIVLLSTFSSGMHGFTPLLLSELHHEFNQPLNVAYIDIKSAFDSVDRCALWKALRYTGAPPFLVNLIKDLCLGTTSRVSVAGQLSQPFETNLASVRAVT